MPAPTTDLFLLEHLERNGATDLATGDRADLNAVAEWIKTFIVKPHDELGRP